MGLDALFLSVPPNALSSGSSQSRPSHALESRSPFFESLQAVFLVRMFVVEATARAYISLELAAMRNLAATEMKGAFMNEKISNPSTEDRQKAAIGMSAINIIVGLWLIISTFVVTAFSNLYSARWNNVLVGILVALFSVVRVSGDQRAG